MPKSVEEILAEVTRVFARILDRPGLVLIEANTAADVEGWDSLSHAELIAAIEAHFEVKFSLREVMRFQNVGSICYAIQAKEV